MDVAINPEVSVIVPARNEEACLAGCLRSLVGQHGPAYEVIVVDDHSGDATRAIAERFPVRVIAAEALPSNWSGKCNAAFAGARSAKGKWLLFTDADTKHAPASIACGLREAIASGAALLSYSPKQEVQGFWERVLMPVIFAELAATYRPADVCNPALPAAAANGQYLLIRRDAYEAIGGHAAVAANILEDVALAKRAKQAGYRLQFRLVGCGLDPHVSQLPADVGGLDEKPGTAFSASARTGPQPVLRISGDCRLGGSGRVESSNGRNNGRRHWRRARDGFLGRILQTHSPRAFRLAVERIEHPRSAAFRVPFAQLRHLS